MLRGKGAPVPELDQPSISELQSAIDSLKKRLDEQNTRLTVSERTCKALAIALREAEKSSKSSLMPAGDYYGIRF